MVLCKKWIYAKTFTGAPEASNFTLETKELPDQLNNGGNKLKINDVEQYSLRNCLRFQEEDEEDTNKVILNIINKVPESKLDLSEIDRTSRVGPAICRWMTQGHNEVLCEAVFLSVDPYMRSFLVPLGTVMMGEQIARRITVRSNVKNMLRVQGIQGINYAQKWPEGLKQMTQWVKEGKIKYKETVTEGFENMVSAFIGLFSGQHVGKAIVKI